MKDAEKDESGYSSIAVFARAMQLIRQDYVDSEKISYEDLTGKGRNQVAFAEADIPVGGLFSGSNETKSSREARLFGGEAGVPRDPNYHQPGDDLDNVDPDTLDLMTDAITHAATRLAQDTGAQDAGTQDSGALD